MRAVFFGLGSDGTVGANKNTIKILGGGGTPGPGLLRLRLQEVGVADDLAPALRSRGDPRPLPGVRRKLRGLPPVRPDRHPRRARPRRPRRHGAAQHQPAARARVGQPHPPGAGTDAREEDRAVRGRRRADRARRRTGRPHQHRAADLLLRDLRRARPRAGDRADQGRDQEDLHAARSGGGRPQHPRGGQLARRPAPSRAAGPRHLDPRAPRAGPRRRAGVRPNHHRGDDGGQGRRAPGQRAPGRRHVSDRHDQVREAQHLRPGRGMGRRSCASSAGTAASCAPTA